MIEIAVVINLLNCLRYPKLRFVKKLHTNQMTQLLLGFPIKNISKDKMFSRMKYDYQSLTSSTWPTYFFWKDKKCSSLSVKYMNLNMTIDDEGGGEVHQKMTDDGDRIKN